MSLLNTEGKGGSLDPPRAIALLVSLCELIPMERPLIVFWTLSVLAIGAGFTSAQVTGWSGPKPDAPNLRIVPEEIRLESSSDIQSIVVQAVDTEGRTLDVTLESELSLADPACARVEDGAILWPQSDGTTELIARWGGLEARARVEVRDSSQDPELSFQRDIMPVFMRAGCNTGKCHGSSRGQDGFRLSLFGYDPAGDYDRLTRQLVGRRINLARPESSLLITKATGQVAHTGGKLLEPGDPLHQALLSWIAAGAPDDSPQAPKAVALEVLPLSLRLAPGDAHRMTVRVRYDDGTDRDVTGLALFLSNDEGIAAIDRDGLVRADRRGEAYVMARFDALTVGATVAVVDLGRTVTSISDSADLAPRGPIDELVDAKLDSLRITPGRPVDDLTFLRRVTLDLNGLVPSVEEIEAFLNDRDPNKRERLVDELLDRDAFSDLWAMIWAERLQVRAVNDVSPKAVRSYHGWLHDRIADDEPIDATVRQIIGAQGSTFANPPANYYQIETDTLQIAQNIAQVFLGMRIQCAQCHNHPFDRWTMDDYYGFSALFARVGYKPGQDPREFIIYDAPQGEIRHPVDNRQVDPRFLGGGELDPEVVGRRQALAEWLTAPDNRAFARNIANVAWHHLFGRGIVDPVDDVRASNPPSNPELLDYLADRLVMLEFDFRGLMREICLSRTYQMTAGPDAPADEDDLAAIHFARGPVVRRLRAEVLLDVISQVTEAPESYAGSPDGARATEIVDGLVSNRFLDTFGRTPRDTACACEVDVEPNLSQALHLLNGDTLGPKIEAGAVVQASLDAGLAPNQIVDALYLRCLTRRPTEAERAAILQALRGQEPLEGLNDLFWALLTSKEFLFQH